MNVKEIKKEIKEIENLEIRALRYAEIFGIVNYVIVNNSMLYFDRYTETEGNKKRMVTYKSSVDLNTLENIRFQVPNRNYIRKALNIYS